MHLPIFSDLGLLVLRSVFGFLTLAHGLTKLGKISGFAINWGLPVPIACLVTTLQIGTGTFLMIGLFVQPAAAINACLNLGIVYSLAVKAKEPFIAPGRHSWSEGLMYLTFSIALTLTGGGAFSIDALLGAPEFIAWLGIVT